MARADFLSILYSQKKSPLEFNFDSLTAPPLSALMIPNDIAMLNDIATSVRYAADIEKKYSAINLIMTKRDFYRLHSGTNRVAYAHYEVPSIISKVAVDRVGLKDSPLEYKNQFMLRPFVTKIFDVSLCGTVGLSERVEPLTTRIEFCHAAEDIFNLITDFIIGRFVLEDFGSDYFMNWGIRKGFGPCLLDFPYLFEIDGSKMVCTLPKIPGTKFPICGGEIDYDIGFNNLICPVCGQRYFARDIQKLINDKSIILTNEEEVNMRVKVFKKDSDGKKVLLCDPGMSSGYIVPAKEKPVYRQASRNDVPVVRIKQQPTTIGDMVNFNDQMFPKAFGQQNVMMTGNEPEKDIVAMAAELNQTLKNLAKDPSASPAVKKLVSEVLDKTEIKFDPSKLETITKTADKRSEEKRNVVTAGVDGTFTISAPGGEIVMTEAELRKAQSIYYELFRVASFEFDFTKYDCNSFKQRDDLIDFFVEKFKGDSRIDKRLDLKSLVTDYVDSAYEFTEDYTDTHDDEEQNSDIVLPEDEVEKQFGIRIEDFEEPPKPKQNNKNKFSDF